MSLQSEERIQALFDRTHMGVRPGLDLITSLLEALGNPQERFLSVHVAGTNGKGSTCAVIEQGLRTLGLQTGLFTSPHLVQVTERIRLNGIPVEEELFEACLERIQSVEESLERLPTFFETLTALAFLCFAESGVQVAVLETGLGGRLDSTNVVNPLLSVITRVDMDHQAYLGSTLAEIAGEKAGILKPGRPAVLGAQAFEAETVLRQRAEKLGCPLRLAPLEVTVSGHTQSVEGQTLHLSTGEAEYGKLTTSLLGRFQIENISTAVVALEEVSRLLNLPLTPAILKKTLKEVHWPARGEVVGMNPPVILDVAHNPGGAEGLAQLLGDLFGRGAKGTFVLASMKDKDTEKIIQILKPFLEHVLAVSVGTERSKSAEDIRLLVEKSGVSAEAVTLSEARERMKNLSGVPFGCITGSVYLAGAWLADRKPDTGDPG